MHNSFKQYSTLPFIFPLPPLLLLPHPIVDHATPLIALNTLPLSFLYSFPPEGRYQVILTLKNRIT